MTNPKRSGNSFNAGIEGNPLPACSRLFMDTQELDAFLRRANEEISKIDPLVTTVLQIHFLIEEHVDLILDKLAKNKKHLGKRPTFAQKVQWIRAFGPLGDAEDWSLLDALTDLRNKVAHKPDGRERKEAMAKLRTEFAKSINREGFDPKDYKDHAILLGSYMLSMVLLATIGTEIETQTTRITL